MIKLENKFWGILESIRGRRDISEMKELFISLVFLKYANDTHITNENYKLDIPQIALWSYLNTNLLSTNFYKVLRTAFNVLEEENKQLEGTFSTFNLKYEQDPKFIGNLFKKISDLDFSEEKLGFSDIIGTLLNRFARHEAKRGADFTTPHSVSQLMTKLLNPKEGLVLDSTCGIGGFFQQIEENSPNGEFQFYGQEINSTTLAIAKLRFAFSQKNAIHFGEPKSTLDEDQFQELKADYVIMHPPFNVRKWTNDNTSVDTRFEFGTPKGNANFAWLQHVTYHLNSNGKGVLLLSNGSLISGGTEGKIRKKLIEADLIEAIITLPSQLLTNTSIPSCIWVLNKNKFQKNKVLFIDGSNLGEKVKGLERVLSSKSVFEISSILHSWQNKDDKFKNITGFIKSVGLKEIIENNYFLEPVRYLGIKELIDVDLSNAILLGDLLEYHKPSRLDINGKYKKVTIKDLSSNPDAYSLNIENLVKGELGANFRLLEKDVLLLAVLGSKIKPTFYKSSKDAIAYSSNSILGFKVDQSIVSLEYLSAELDKEYIKAQIEVYRKGAGIPMIRKVDLLKIKVIIPLLKEQNEIFEKERELRFQLVAKDLGFEKEIAKLKQSQMKDLGSKKHNIMQHLNNVKASADVLIKMMELNNGILKSVEVIDPRRGVTVEKRFVRLQESLGKVIYYVDNITNELKYDDAEIIDSLKFITECKERLIQGGLFSVEIQVDKISLKGREPLISISKNDFEELYNNLLENAIKHGFVDVTKSYIFRISISYIDDNLEIYFQNNGKPFPIGITKKIDVKGEKAGSTAGTGIGLWKVAEIAKHFGCKLEVSDEPSNEFPVGFKFKFNLETL